MPHVMTLKDGRNETLFAPIDFERLIDQYMGYEAAKYFRANREEMEEALKDAKDTTQSDLSSYEASLESNTQAFNDLLEQVESLESELSNNRLNRTTLSNLVAECRTIINNQI